MVLDGKNCKNTNTAVAFMYYIERVPMLSQVAKKRVSLSIEMPKECLVSQPSASLTRGHEQQPGPEHLLASILDITHKGRPLCSNPQLPAPGARTSLHRPFQFARHPTTIIVTCVTIESMKGSE